MRNNIIIVGTSRSGKTTLAMKINKKYGYSIINLDSVISGLKNGLPELNIGLCLTGKEDSTKVSKFLDAYMSSLNNFNNIQRGINFVIEGSYVKIEDVKKYQRKYHVIVLVEKYRTTKEYYDKLLKFDTGYDWTAQITKDELYKYAKHLKKDNNRIIRYCRSHNISFYDTANDREKILEDIMEKIENESIISEKDILFKEAVHYGSLCVNVSATKPLLDALHAKYEGIFTFDHRFKDACYDLVFVDEVSKYHSRPCHAFFDPGLECEPKFTINNNDKVCRIYFDDTMTEKVKKRIVRKFTYNTFIRLYEEKGALLLHCSCVEKNNNVYIFPAYKNSGKTVTLLNFLKHGYNFITNDFLIVDKDGGKLNFLIAPLYVGIRRTKTWLDLPENAMYKELKQENYVRIDNERIFLRPVDLIALNGVDYGKIDGKLKAILSPKYSPNEDFQITPFRPEELKELMLDNSFKKYMNYRSSDPNYKNPLYGVRAGIENKSLKREIFSELMSTKAYKIKQNENNYTNMFKFLEKNGEKTK